MKKTSAQRNQIMTALGSLVGFVLAYAFLTRAFSTGSYWHYLFAVVFLVLGVKLAIRTFKNMAKQVKLDKLQAKILTDKVCPDLAEQATQLVFGSGNPDAEVVFIGEAPGKKEDLSGEPFVGAAGKFLNEMLESVGMKRDDIYITNIVKYRPPDNRDPLPDEKSDFLPYLQAQLDIIQPKVVATLGRHSMNCFLPDLQISKVHGQPKHIIWVLTHGEKKEGTELSLVILPLYHPAAALYNGGLRQTLIEDFANLPSILEKL